VERYITPGVLWAFNRADATDFLEQRARLRQATTGRSGVREPQTELNNSRDPARAVVLVDEIDKADPEVPNDLLEVFGMNRFVVDELSPPDSGTHPARVWPTKANASPTAPPPPSLLGRSAMPASKP
jgi:MoxR-like ATPase